MSPILTPLPSPLPEPGSFAGRPTRWNVMPFPHSSPLATPAPRPSALPPWPEPPASGPTGFPAAGTQSGPAATKLPAFPSLQTAPARCPVPTPEAKPAVEKAVFTDDDLRETFNTTVEQAVRKAVDARENGIAPYLEPMLRATIRRALAEYAPASRPFQPPRALDRFAWRVQALFTSRTYEDIFFEKTRRFRVEEIFLLDGASLALISFASCDPARHASVRRVAGTVHRLTRQLRDGEGKIRPAFELADRRHVISRQGRHVVLMALIRGIPGELACADLEFSLRRIEDHFRDQFQQEGSALLHTLQPFLEDGLLIQAPASAA